MRQSAGVAGLHAPLCLELILWNKDPRNCICTYYHNDANGGADDANAAGVDDSNGDADDANVGVDDADGDVDDAKATGVDDADGDIPPFACWPPPSSPLHRLPCLPPRQKGPPVQCRVGLYSVQSRVVCSGE